MIKFEDISWEVWRGEAPAPPQGRQGKWEGQIDYIIYPADLSRLCNLRPWLESIAGHYYHCPAELLQHFTVIVHSKLSALVREFDSEIVVMVSFSIVLRGLLWRAC